MKRQSQSQRDQLSIQGFEARVRQQLIFDSHSAARGDQRGTSALPRNAVIGLTDDMDEAAHPSPMSMSSNDGQPTPASSASPPASRKRSNAEDGGGSLEDMPEPVAKKRRMEGGRPPTPSPTPEPEEMAEIVSTPSFDHGSQELLRRSCALALNHVGFDGATTEALEAFRGEVDIYMMKLLSYITEAMLAARRSQPTPLDFEFALRHMGLTARLLKPHLKPPVPTSKTRLSFLHAELPSSLPETPAALLGKDLSGESDKKTKQYIPSAFPSFPSKHTYLATPVIADRDKDPRRIREKATEAARNAEDALRRLVKEAKSGNTGMKRGTENNVGRKGRNSTWGSALADLVAEKPGVAAEQQSIAVDAGKQFWRKSVQIRRR